MSKRPLTTLNIFMSKPGVVDPDVIMKDRSDYASYQMKVGDEFAGVLYVRASQPSPPDWASYLAPAVDGNLADAGLSTSSASAVWLIQRSDQVFAITFGYGRFMLKDEGIDQRFGLRCTLNAIDSLRIRSLDRKSFERVQRLTREQVSRESDLGAFGIHVEQDLLRAVTGSPLDPAYGHRLSGRDCLAVSTRASIAEVPELLDRYLELSRQDRYRSKFPWVDNIAEIGDSTLSHELFEKLVVAIRSGETEKIWLAPPEILKWEEIAGFSYRKARSAAVFEDMLLEDYLDDVGRSDNLEVKHLSRDRVLCIDTTGASSWTSWNIRNCLCAELRVDGEVFVLSEGRWYRIDQEYAERVEEGIRQIPTTTETLPTYGHASEPAYNAYAAQESNGRFALLDCQLVNSGTAPGQIEVCDLFSQDRVLIHVKRYGASSVLSHLFAQGVVSARLLHLDRTFRLAFNEILPDSHRLADPAERIEPRDYEVAYAIVGPSNRPLQLPFFSQVNLKQAADLLQEIGFRVTLTEIKHDELAA